MKLSDHDLQQIDSNWLDVRSQEELLHVSKNLLDDLKEARERINQNSANSSIPSGSEPPWYKPSDDEDENDDEATLADTETDKDDDISTNSTDEKNNSDQTDSPTEDSLDLDQKASTAPPEEDEEIPRKAGRQPGSQGFGRTQSLPITEIQHHHAEQCSGCGNPLPEEAPSRAYTGFYDTLHIPVDSFSATNPVTVGRKNQTVHYFWLNMKGLGFIA